MKQTQKQAIAQSVTTAMTSAILTAVVRRVWLRASPRTRAILGVALLAGTVVLALRRNEDGRIEVG